jgi:hypothetical protein
MVLSWPNRNQNWWLKLCFSKLHKQKSELQLKHCGVGVWKVFGNCRKLRCRNGTNTWICNLLVQNNKCARIRSKKWFEVFDSTWILFEIGFTKLGQHFEPSTFKFLWTLTRFTDHTEVDNWKESNKWNFSWILVESD